ncbi:hypothetical protein [Serinicoccus kebangsaanensis]|uniref:hypothetical protein n=1 Tax=Serinicoccus kebangsaanensis TaxID=2602069 RepID=UPI00124DA2BD|nr:hypothetical protein [Serinicoccus kebangsaanensis]
MGWSPWEQVGARSRYGWPVAIAATLPEVLSVFYVHGKDVMWANDGWDSGPHWDGLRWANLGRPNPLSNAPARFPAVVGLRAGVNQQLLVRQGDTFFTRGYPVGGSNWGEWTPIPDFYTPGRPAMARPASKRFELVWWTGEDYWYRTWLDGRWLGGVSIHGFFLSSPAVASSGEGRIDVFGVGGGREFFHAWHQEGHDWSGWHSLGGAARFRGAPGAVSPRPGQLATFHSGNDDWLYMNFHDGSRWSGWQRLPGQSRDTPVAVSSVPGTIDLFVVGLDGETIFRSRLTL